MTNAQQQQRPTTCQPVELVDTQTGLKNDKIQKKAGSLSYHSTKTLLLEQQDVANLQKFEILKKETFDYFKKQAGVLNNVEFIKQLIADVEYVFYSDRASGKAKQELVYQSFLQYVFQLDNVTYDTYQKNNLIIMIDEIFKNNKKDLLKICVKFHNGLDMPKTGACYRG